MTLILPIGFAQEPYLVTNNKGARFIECFILRVTFPRDVPADMVTGRAELLDAEKFERLPDQQGAISHGEMTSSEVRTLPDGQKQFDLEFWGLAINRTGRYCVGFTVDYYNGVNPRKTYGYRISTAVNIE